MSQLSDDLRALGPRAKKDLIDGLAASAPALMEKYEINTPLRQCHFWAQWAHESGDFRYMQEIWGPTPAQARYEGRKDLGNIQKGDGFRFRGRGLAQLTGRANYAEMSKKIGVDLIANPDEAAKPPIALQIACEYWKSRKINALADKDDVVGVTKKINGGTNGLQDRKAQLALAKKMWADNTPEDAPVQKEEKPEKTMLQSKQGNGAIAIGAIGSVGAVKEIAQQAQEATDVFGQITGLLKNPSFLMMVAIVVIGGAIWYWRKKNLEEHGV